MGFSAASRLFDALLADDAIGTDLPQVGGYVLSSRLGRGGCGTVYVGHRVDSDRDVAIKVLNASLDQGSGAQRAWRELDALTQLRLPCTPRVHDYGVHEGSMYIATERVDGVNLSEYCRAQGLDRRQRVELLAKVAGAVQTIHEYGVIHRDIKPDNILIDKHGQPVIIDLGIASLMSVDVEEMLTASGVPIGTPAFMSPEQARGDREAVSTRSDVYSLGATACYVLTGHTPHELDAPLHEAIRRVAQDPSRRPRALDPSLPKALSSVLEKALSPISAHRYASAADLAEDLRRWLRGEPIDWTGPSIYERVRFWSRRNTRLALLGVTAILALSAAIILGALAVANAAVAQDEAELAASKAELAASKAAHLEELEDFKKRAKPREERLQARRKRQISRVRLALEEGPLFDATVVLLNLAEEIEAEQLDDPEALALFTSLLGELFDEAVSQKKQAETQEPDTNGVTDVSTGR